MGNSIFISPVMKTFYSHAKTAAATASQSSASYLEILSSLQEPQETEKSGDTASMTMDEYKEYITGKMNSLPMHSSRSDSTSAVIISNAGWERMKSDPSYEQWVLGTVASDFASQDPWETVGSSSYSIYRFGDTMEQYSCDQWGKDYPGSIKDYLASELLNTSSLGGSGNLLFRIACKKMQQQNQAAIQQLASNISQLQSLALMGMDKSSTGLLSDAILSANHGFQLATSQNALTLLGTLNAL